MLSKLWLSFKLALIIIKKTTATKCSNSRVSRWNFTIDSIYLNIIKDIFIKYLVGLALEYKWYFSNTNQENNSNKNFKFTCGTILYPKWAFTIGSMGPFFNYFDQNCAHYWSKWPTWGLSYRVKIALSLIMKKPLFRFISNFDISFYSRVLLKSKSRGF